MQCLEELLKNSCPFRFYFYVDQSRIIMYFLPSAAGNVLRNYNADGNVPILPHVCRKQVPNGVAALRMLGASW